jgi:phage FluMu protein Com
MEGAPMFPWGNPGWLLKCPKCGKDSVALAIKCEKCGEIFLENPEATYMDKCPKCDFSAIEEVMKERQAEQAKPGRRR